MSKYVLAVEVLEKEAKRLATSISYSENSIAQFQEQLDREKAELKAKQVALQVVQDSAARLNTFE